MFENLFRDGYKGTGAEKPRNLGSVHFALNYLANPKAHKLGDKVAVIGNGCRAYCIA